MPHDLSKMMELQLATHGIFLDPPKPNLDVRVIQVPVARVGVDRAAVRKTLIERGATAHDIEWLTESAPSVQAARDFTPPRKL